MIFLSCFSRPLWRAQTCNVLAILLALLITGCSAGLDPNGLRPAIPENSERGFSDQRISIGSLQDLRDSKVIGDYDGESLQLQGDSLHYVRTALEEVIKQKGYQQGAFDAPVVTIGLRGWDVALSRDFTMIDAKASSLIKVSVFYPHDSLVYVGEFEGHSGYRAPLISQARIEQLLGEALTYAMQAFVKDPGFEGIVRELSEGTRISSPPDRLP